MTLCQVVERLRQFPDDWTIYAHQPWDNSSEAIVCMEPDDGTIPEQAAGMDYFLEVFVALEFLEGWPETATAIPQRICQRLIRYAKDDA